MTTTLVNNPGDISSLNSDDNINYNSNKCLARLGSDPNKQCKNNPKNGIFYYFLTAYPLRGVLHINHSLPYLLTVRQQGAPLPMFSYSGRAWLSSSNT